MVDRKILDFRPSRTAHVPVSTQRSQLVVTVRKILVLALALVLITQLLVSSELTSAYAVTGAPPRIRVNLKMDIDNAKGFEKIGRTFSFAEFVLKSGNTGTLNITLSSEENETVNVTLSYEGSARYNYSLWKEEGNIPDGITYSFEPSINIALAPYSSVTETLRISASKYTAIRNYNLSLYLRLVKGDQEEGHGYSTSLTIIDNTSSSIPSSTTTTVATRLTEGAAEPLVYAWAIGATVIAVFLAIILLRKRSNAVLLSYLG